jgi:hypothetical protein
VPFGFVLLDRRLKRDLKLERALPAVVDRRKVW